MGSGVPLATQHTLCYNSKINQNIMAERKRKHEVSPSSASAPRLSAKKENKGGLVDSVRSTIKGAVDGVSGAIDGVNRAVDSVGDTVGAVRAATYNLQNAPGNMKKRLTGDVVLFEYHDGRRVMKPLKEASKLSFEHQGKIVKEDPPEDIKKAA